MPQAPAVKQAEAKLLQARARPGPGPAEPPLLRRRQRDRRRGDPPQRQPRQQRPGGAEPDGGPVAHGDLDRCQLQGDAARRTCASAIGCAARWTCTASRREYEGRITGFTMGTGQTLALLPPQNATGNFVKIVQRLPVRVELTDYDPDKAPLFVGLSVVPYVYYKEPPAGPHAGEMLAAALPASARPRRCRTTGKPRHRTSPLPEGPSGP